MRYDDSSRTPAPVPPPPQTPTPAPVPPPPQTPTPAPLPSQASPSSAGPLGQISSYVAAHKIQTMGAAALAAVGFLAVVLLLAGNGGDGPPPPPPSETSRPTATQTLSSPAAPPSPGPGACTLPSAADVMENALPSIVQVLTDSGSGSGFIVNESGLVVTNQHVVEGGRIVRVRLGNGRNTYPGEVVERHSSLDLAYIQIDSRLEFTPIAIGDSDEIRVGEEVIAIGFPLGSELGDAATITTGVISAKREDLDFLQTDASLNPGNSGGPLLNGYGYVVGVNTAGIEQRDGRAISGINFAIPINEIKKPLGSQITSGQPVCDSPAESSQNLTLAPTPVTNVPTPTITPVPAAAPSPTPTPPAEATSTPSPTPTPPPPVTIAPTATPNPSATLTPTPTPTPTARPTRRPTATPTATPVPTPSSTPTPAPTPTPNWVWRVHEDSVYRYTIQYEQSWVLASGESAGNRPFLHIQVQDFESGETSDSFFQRRRSELLDAAREGIYDPSQPFFEPGKTGSGRQKGLNPYRSSEYLWRPRDNSCMYHVVEHTFRSWYFPAKRYGFIVSVGICEEDLATHSERRGIILSSFEEQP